MLIRHLELYLNSLKSRMAERNMMDGILYRRIDSIEHLIDTVVESDDICNLIKRFSDIRLIVLDSIAFHFRYSLLSSFEQTSSNIGKLHRIAQALNCIAYKFNLVVIITNQMTTRPKPSGNANYIYKLWGQNGRTTVSFLVALF